MSISLRLFTTYKTSKMSHSLEQTYLQRLQLFKLEIIQLRSSDAKLSFDRYQKHQNNRFIPVMLDEQGLSKTTVELSQFLQHPQKGLDFLLGGPEGFAAAFYEKKFLMMKLSDLTLPMHLARVFLIEQIYRCETLIKGHPYHNA